MTAGTFRNRLLFRVDHAPGRSRAGTSPGEPGTSYRLRNHLREKNVHRRGIELPRGAQGSRECPAPLGQTQTPEVGM
jgi:hypothetical protein